MKEKITLNVEDQVLKDFKKKCIDKGITYGEVVEKLMTAYTGAKENDKQEWYRLHQSW